MKASGGRITHKHSGADGTRIVEAPYGMCFGFVSEQSGMRGYAIVTPDGRGHVAFAETLTEAVREVCDTLQIDPKSVIGSRALTPSRSG